MIISEIVVTAIAFIGAYYIFKPILDKNKKAKEDQEKGRMDESSAKAE
jgi:hypothetical protein